MSGSTKGLSAAGLRRFKRYPTYKDSGVEWLGEIPAHWQIKRLKHCVSKIGSGKTPSGGADVYVSEGVMLLRSQNVHYDGLRLDDVAFVDSETDAEMAGSRVQEEDVLLNITGASLGRCCLARLNGVRANVNQHVCVIRPVVNICAPAFLAASVASRSVQAQIFNTENGISRDALNFEHIAELVVCQPSSEEQRAIATFLDRETARIDALVAKKERLIELLEEKRTTLITRAVTKGLDPNAPMKDSGVEWLGEIPAHWDVDQNRWLFREADLRSHRGEEELLTVSHITGVTRRSEKPDVAMIEAESHEGYKICRGDQLAINTMWAWMGALGIAREDGMVSPSYNVYRIVHAGLAPRYYDYLCRTPLHVAEIIRHSKGIWRSRLRLYPEAFLDISTPLPSLVEQGAIVVFLDREASKIEVLIGKVHHAIDRLKELRIALISAAVTGKIDVRDLA